MQKCNLIIFFIQINISGEKENAENEMISQIWNISDWI